MGRGAPYKKDLTYFPKMTDFYEDDKIFDLLDRYGPLGVTVYDCILCIVYKHGYYAEIPLNKLSKMVIKMIGNKWVKSQKAVVQVVHFCSEIGLFDNDLMTENIITSVGIQRRYYEIAVKRMKRQLYTDKYWLLGKTEDGEPLLSTPLKGINSEENQETSEVNRKPSELIPIEKKENKNIYTPFQSPELEQAFQTYLLVRNHNYGEILQEQVEALREELEKLSSDDRELLAIVKKATAGGWKGFYPLKKRTREPKKEKKNGFNNFEGRDYSGQMDDLTRALIEGGKNGDIHS